MISDLIMQMLYKETSDSGLGKSQLNRDTSKVMQVETQYSGFKYVDSGTN